MIPSLVIHSLAWRRTIYRDPGSTLTEHHMRENRLRTRWQQGKAALCAWLTIPSTFSAEIMAHTGFDCLTIDLQHGLIDYQAAVPMLQAISTTEVTPLARVPWNDPGIIMKLLDAGCYGIICPMINNVEEAAAFAAVCRYPPVGIRSYGPKRAMIYAGDDYPHRRQRHGAGYRHDRDRGRAGQRRCNCRLARHRRLYIGPADLSLALGRSQRTDQTDPVMVEALEAILAAAQRHGKVAGLHTATPAYAYAMLEKGFQLVTVATDAGFLEAEARRVAAATRGGNGAGQRADPY
jgi:4-hydroxy-2-oxoheptanedioate aldolase